MVTYSQGTSSVPIARVCQVPRVSKRRRRGGSVL